MTSESRMCKSLLYLIFSTCEKGVVQASLWCALDFIFHSLSLPTHPHHAQIQVIFPQPCCKASPSVSVHTDKTIVHSGLVTSSSPSRNPHCLLYPLRRLTQKDLNSLFTLSSFQHVKARPLIFSGTLKCNLPMLRYAVWCITSQCYFFFFFLISLLCGIIWHKHKRNHHRKMRVQDGRKYSKPVAEKSRKGEDCHSPSKQLAIV